jgi:hypothetical protein
MKPDRWDSIGGVRVAPQAFMILSCVGPRNQTGRTSDLVLAKHSLFAVALCD